MGMNPQLSSPGAFSLPAQGGADPQHTWGNGLQRFLPQALLEMGIGNLPGLIIPLGSWPPLLQPLGLLVAGVLPATKIMTRLSPFIPTGRTQPQLHKDSRALI